MKEWKCTYMTDEQLDKYDKIKDLYWILTYISDWEVEENKYSDWMNWVICTHTPRQPPNKSMNWRRPTFDEFIIRQLAYIDDPEYFIKRCEESSKNLKCYKVR